MYSRLDLASTVKQLNKKKYFQCFVWREHSHQYSLYAICCSQGSSHQTFKISSCCFLNLLHHLCSLTNDSPISHLPFTPHPCLFLPRSSSVCNLLSSSICPIHNTSLTLSVLLQRQLPHHLPNCSQLDLSVRTEKSLFNSVK